MIQGYFRQNISSLLFNQNFNFNLRIETREFTRVSWHLYGGYRIQKYNTQIEEQMSWSRDFIM